jgi:monoamine oxidase/SAM-dependent methyltransferase
MDSDAVVMDGRFLADLDAIAERYGNRTANDIKAFRRTCARMMSPEQYYEGSSREDNDHPWADLTERELLDTHVSDPVARRYFEVMARSDVASEPHLTNGLNALKNMLMDVDGYIGVSSIVGGNERLVEELASRISATIHLNHRVTRIGRTKGGRYAVTTLVDGLEAVSEFDFVVVCLPHNWLSTVVFEGEALKREMDAHIAHFDRPAHYLRLSVLFKTPFWRSHVEGSWFMSDAFGGCCVYDEGSRHDVGSHGVLNWLISGSACLAWVNAEPAALLEHALATLPADVRDEAREQVMEWHVHPYLASVNAIPGGMPVRSARENHTPEPKEHPGLLITGDYLFDSTLNGLLDSADYATDQLLALVMAKRYATGSSLAVQQGRAPSPSTRIDRTYFDRYRGKGPYEDVWRQHSDPVHIAELLSIVWDAGEGASVLVAGSASGQLVGALRELGYRAVGIENDAKIHSRTPDDLKAFNRRGSVLDLPFKDGSFDVVIESCLCHVAPRSVDRAIRQIQRVAKRGLFFRSVTADLCSEALDTQDMLRGVRTLSTWWDWSDRLFDADFDLAVADQSILEALWDKTVAAGLGPGRWHEDIESLRYCFFDTAAWRARRQRAALASSRQAAE